MHGALLWFSKEYAWSPFMVLKGTTKGLETLGEPCWFLYKLIEPLWVLQSLLNLSGTFFEGSSPGFKSEGSIYGQKRSSWHLFSESAGH